MTQQSPMNQQVDITLELSLWLDATMDEDDIVTHVRASPRSPRRRGGSVPSAVASEPAMRPAPTGRHPTAASRSRTSGRAPSPRPASASPRRTAT
jgi:hypothetical protein